MLIFVLYYKISFWSLSCLKHSGASLYLEFIPNSLPSLYGSISIAYYLAPTFSNSSASYYAPATLAFLFFKNCSCFPVFALNHCSFLSLQFFARTLLCRLHSIQLLCLPLLFLLLSKYLLSTYQVPETF